MKRTIWEQGFFAPGGEDVQFGNSKLVVYSLYQVQHTTLNEDT